MRDSHVLRRYYEWMIILALGAVPLLGGVGFLLLAIPAAIALIVKDGMMRPRGMELYIGIVALVYFFYFATTAFIHDFDDRTVMLVVNNAAFLFVFPLVIAMRFVDFDYVFEMMARLLLPIALALLTATLIERHVYGVARTELFTVNPLIFSSFIVSSVYLSLTAWRGRSTSWRIGALIAWFIGFYIIVFLSQSRANALIYMIGAIAFFKLSSVHPVQGWSRNLHRLFVIAGISVVLLGFALYVLYVTAVMPRLNDLLTILFTGEGELDPSSRYRFDMARIALGRLDEAPIFGFGIQNTFEIVKPEWPHDPSLGHLHSDILNHLIGGGLIGLLIYLALVATPIIALTKTGFRSRRVIYVGVMVFILIVFGGLTARMFLRPNLLTWAIFAIVVVVGICEQNLRRKYPSGKY